jgi:hypothetical protein
VHELATVPPFSRNSYVFNSGTNITNFGSINVYDFTMNTNAGAITRDASGNWNIDGTLRVGNGTISMGSNSGTTNVNNVAVGNGTIDLSSAAGAITNVKGNIMNSGSGQLNANNGTVVLNGTSNQNINMSSNTFGTGKSFYNLTINNAAGITAMNDLRIDNVLTLTNGKVNAGGNFVRINSNSPSAIAGGNANSYVYNGDFKAAINANGVAADYKFPVGSTTNFQDISLSFAATNYVSTLNVGFKDNVTGSGNNSDVNGSLNTQTPPVVVSGTTIVGGLNAGYWAVSEDGATGTPDYTIVLKMAGATNLPSSPISPSTTGAEQLAVVKAADVNSAWQDQGIHSNSTQSIMGGVATAVRSGLNSFSIFAIGIGSGNLPIRFVKAIGKAQSGVGYLEWEVADIASIEKFDIEQSTNGVSFFKVRSQLAFANINSYTSTGLNIGGGNYFRIKAIEKTGESNYSRIIKLSDNKANSLVLFPNPASRFVHVTSDLLRVNNARISIVNIAGQQVYSETLKNTNSSNLKLNLPALQKGSYRLTIFTGNESETSVLHIQ